MVKVPPTEIVVERWVRGMNRFQGPLEAFLDGRVTWRWLRSQLLLRAAPSRKDELVRALEEVLIYSSAERLPELMKHLREEGWL